MNFFRSISLLFLSVLLFTGCIKTTYIPLNSELSAFITVDKEEVSKFNLKIKFIKRSFDGILIVRQMDDQEIRFLGITPFGLSLFDFGLKEETWTVYSCIEPMKKKRLLKIFEEDFKLLFLPNRNIKKKKTTVDYTKFVSGRGLSKRVIQVSTSSEVSPDHVEVKHPWLRLAIFLDKMQDSKCY